MGSESVVGTQTRSSHEVRCCWVDFLIIDQERGVTRVLEGVDANQECSELGYRKKGPQRASKI